MSERPTAGVLTEDAPAKINLNLFIGPTRDDGRHELVSVMESITLSDRLVLRTLPDASADEVHCPGVPGENLAARALRDFRAATGWRGDPVHLTIEKRIPVAAGLGGGSADAAAALRLAARVSGHGDDALLVEVATGLGADVPAQVRPGRVLATGAGERLERLPDPEPYGILVLPSRAELSTAAVYREADRLGTPRDARSLADALRAARSVPIVNELEPAARSLCPAIDEALAAARATGARHALVSGSGPTVLGLFDAPADAERAAEALGGRVPRPVAARPVAARAGAPTTGDGR